MRTPFRQRPPWSPSVVKHVLFGALLSLGAASGVTRAWADTFRDFGITGITISNASGGGYDVVVNAPVIPGNTAPTQNILIRLLQNAVPVADIIIPCGGKLPAKTCCVNTCAAPDNWTFTCEGTCAPNPGAPKLCVYRSRKASVHGLLLQDGAQLVAVADPLGQHTQTMDQIPNSITTTVPNDVPNVSPWGIAALTAVLLGSGLIVLRSRPGTMLKT